MRNILLGLPASVTNSECHLLVIKTKKYKIIYKGCAVAGIYYRCQRISQAS